MYYTTLAPIASCHWTPSSDEWDKRKIGEVDGEHGILYLVSNLSQLVGF